MHRLLLLFSVLSLAAAAAMPAAMAGAQGRHASGVICPGSEPAGVVPCCPVPTGGSSFNCCPVPTPTGCSSVSIAASPNPMIEGRKVKISGQLNGSSSGGVSIALWEKLPGQHTFHQVAQTKTDSAGSYAFVRRHTVQTTRSWYVTAPAGRSITIMEKVKALVSLAAAPKAGHAVKLSGRVTPTHRERVAIQELVGGAWQTIAKAPLNSASRYRINHTFSAGGTVKLRALFGGDRRNVRSTSRVITVTVT